MSTTISDEELFSDKPIEIVYEDILSIDFNKSRELGSDRMVQLQALSCSSADIKHIGELKKRILENIHVYSHMREPITLLTLNRRYGRIASKLNTNVRTLIDHLALNNKVVFIENTRKRAVYSKAVLDETNQMRKRLMMPPLETNVDSLLENAK